MLKVTITTFDAGVTVQDPKPVTTTKDDQAVISVDPNDSREMIMQWGQLERIQGQLTNLAAAGFCTFVIEPVGTADGVAEFAEQVQNADAPIIDAIDNGGAAIALAGDTFDVVGTNLLGGQVQASATIAADTAAGSVLLEDLNPSYDGNFYDFEVVDSGGGGLAVTSSVVSGRTVIEVDLGGSGSETCTGVTSAINTAMAGLVFATAVGVGSTVVSTIQAVTAFTGGIGLGFSVALAGIACTVNSIDITSAPVIKVNVTNPSLAGVGVTADDSVTLSVRANDKLATASIIIGTTANPLIGGLDNGGAAITLAGDTFDILGTNLTAGQVRASATMVADTGAGSVLLEDLSPSYAGNLYDFEVIDSGGGGFGVTSASVVGRTVITVDLGGAGASDCTTVAAAVNVTMAGLVQATAVGTGGTAFSTIQAVTALTGGTGTGLSVTLAGFTCTVNTIDESATPEYTISVTNPNIGASGLTAGDSAELVVIADGVIVSASTVLA